MQKSGSGEKREISFEYSSRARSNPQEEVPSISISPSSQFSSSSLSASVTSPSILFSSLLIISFKLKINHIFLLSV